MTLFSSWFSYVNIGVYPLMILNQEQELKSAKVTNSCLILIFMKGKSIFSIAQ